MEEGSQKREVRMAAQYACGRRLTSGDGRGKSEEGSQNGCAVRVQEAADFGRWKREVRSGKSE
jgi:hypothetical protein